MTSSSIVMLLVIMSPMIFGKNVDFDTLLESSEENLDSDASELSNSIEQTEEKHEKYTVCETDACKAFAKHILKGMNRSANPCDDFYAHTCGGWNSQDLIPPYEGSWGNFKIFQDTVHRRIKGALETDPEPTDILPIRQAKKWYRSCMDTKVREKRGLKPVESILLQTGGWPMTMDSGEWDEDDYTWERIEKQLFRVTGSFIFYEIGITYGFVDDELATQAMINRGLLPLLKKTDGPRNYTGARYKAYKHLIEDIAKEFVKHSKADVSNEALHKDVEDLVEFEQKLQEIMTGDRYSEETTIGEFVDAYNGNTTDVERENRIDFRRKIKMFFDLGHFDTNDSTIITVRYPQYYLKLTTLLSETPVRTIVNYLHWNFISQVLKFTTEKMENILFKFAEVEDGITEKPPRWLQCVQDLQMEHAASYAFVKKYFHDSTEKAVHTMIKNIQKEMQTQIDKSDYLNDEGKDYLKEKLNDMRFYVGYPDWYKNKTTVMNSYKGLKIGYDYFENVLSYLRYKTVMTMQAVMHHTRDGPWGGVPATLVNAMYGGNEINLPAADFQPPLFTEQLPESINYGVTGVVVGHEIGHGFDDSGIKMGLGFESTELSDQMLEMYSKRADCFLDQFNDYWGVTESTLGGTTPEYEKWSLGRKTRGENIADTTGLHSVFEAYRKMQEKQSTADFKLPGFEDYTDEQMFFVAYGTIWCEINRPEYAEKLRTRDVHSPGRLRVIGAVSNTNDFAKVFNCPKGSPMNPEDKCNIWKGAEGKKKSPKSPSRRRHSGASIILD